MAPGAENRGRESNEFPPERRFLPGEIRDRPATPETAGGWERDPLHTQRSDDPRQRADEEERRRKLAPSLGRAAVTQPQNRLYREIGREAIQDRDDANNRGR
jgi:hypothetical protein